MKQLKWYGLILMVVLCACRKMKEVNDKTIISVGEVVGTGEILNLSDYAKSIEYIPLETTDSLLVGDIEGFVYEKGRIILDDFQNGMCLLFNDKGKFICQIGDKGEGPKEYIGLRSANVIFKDDAFFIDGYPRRYYLYDLNGNFIKQYPYPEYPKTYRPWTTVALDTNILFSDLTSPEHLYYRGIFIGEKVNEKQKLFLNYMDLEKEKKGNWGGPEGAILWNREDTLRYFRKLNDTIYSITPDMNIRASFTFDWGIYKAPAVNLINLVHDEKYIVFYFDGIKESSRFLFFDFYFGQHAPEVFERTFRDKRGKMVTRTYKNVYGLFDKSTGNLTLLNQPIKKQLGFRNDMDGGPTFWPRYISSDDKMMAWWNAEEFLSLYEQLKNPSPELQKLAEKLTPDDNPILMVVTLK